MGEVLDELLREHKSVASVLNVLERQVQIFETGGRPDYELIEAAVEYFLGFPDRCHHPKEDLVFARLRQRDPDAARKVGDLAAAHVALAENLRIFAAGLQAVVDEAELPRAAVVRWARGFIELQRQHLAMEEAALFPAAEAALTPRDWSELAAAMTKAPDPLVHGDPEARFEALRRNILAWQAEDDQTQSN
jgi:hemerythrin-like domain-containing protein